MLELIGLLITNAYRKYSSISFCKVANRFWQFVLKKVCMEKNLFWDFVLFPIVMVEMMWVSFKASRKGMTVDEYLAAESARIDKRLNETRKKLEDIKIKGGAS